MIVFDAMFTAVTVPGVIKPPLIGPVTVPAVMAYGVAVIGWRELHELHACGCPKPWCICTAVSLKLNQFLCLALPWVSYGNTVATIKPPDGISFVSIF